MDLTFSIDKFNFGVDKIIIIEYLCERYSKKSNLENVDAITKMKAYNSIIEVKRFFGTCLFY